MNNTIDQLPTTERLALALEALADPALVDMIALARAGYYDDYKSPTAAPHAQLVFHIRVHGHPEFARRVIDGEFDATREEGEAWINSPDGQAAIAQFQNRKD